MRISILCTTDSQKLIQHLLATQPLATQASVAREAFELGLRTLMAEAEQPEDEPEPDLTGAQHDIKQAQVEPEQPEKGVLTMHTPEPAQPAPTPEPSNWPPLELEVEDEDAELSELIDSL